MNEDSEADETTTEVPTESHEVVTRSLNDKIIFTRRGSYQLIESRLNA